MILEFIFSNNLSNNEEYFDIYRMLINMDIMFFFFGLKIYSFFF